MSTMTKKMKVIFTISIVLNVLFIGLTAGTIYKRWTDNPLHRMQAEMSPEARNVVARTMQKAFRDGKDQMRRARTIKKDIQKILAAEDFDEQAFEREARKLHEVMSAMGQKRIAVTKELASQLSPKDRRVLAEKFSRGFHGHDKKARKDRPHEFLKDHDSPGRQYKAPEEGPDLPDDMPPQPE